MFEQHVTDIDKVIIHAHHVEKQRLALHLLSILHPHFKVSCVMAERSRSRIGYEENKKTTKTIWNDVFSPTFV